MNNGIWKLKKKDWEQTHPATVTQSHWTHLFSVFQINSPRHLPLKGCGKVVQAACGGTQVAVLNGQFVQIHLETILLNVDTYVTCEDELQSYRRQGDWDFRFSGCLEWTEAFWPDEQFKWTLVHEISQKSESTFCLLVASQITCWTVWFIVWFHRYLWIYIFDATTGITPVVSGKSIKNKTT